RDTRRRRLKRWVLLALRVGCVVLAVLLFARPYRAEAIGGGDSGLTVVLIDRSASMDRQRDGERLIERAIKKLPDVVARIPTRSPARRTCRSTCGTSARRRRPTSRSPRCGRRA